MKSILVVDDMAIFREPIAASLRLAGYETLCASDGDEALTLARERRPDLILLDVSMPKMDGLTFLKHLRANESIAKTNVILLTALSDKTHVMAAASLGVRDYLLKSRFRLSELLERIKKLEAPGSSTTDSHQSETAASNPESASTNGQPAQRDGIPTLLTRDKIIRRIERSFQTKTLSGVVAQVISVASSPRGDINHFAELIIQDPVLSARVLRAANSAMYASAGPPVMTIPAALRKVGFSTVRNIAAALGVFDCMPAASADGFNPIMCWQHSFAVAQLCERLAKGNLSDRSGVAYIVGLCHDLGDIFIRMQFNKEYEQVIAMAEKTRQPMEQVHLQMLGMTRSHMINAVLKCMKLPDEIRGPIEIHHSQDELRKSNPLARILWMAENYANAAMLASSSNSEVVPLTQAFCRAAVGQQNPTRPDPQALRSEVVSLTTVLAGLSPADESKLLAPMFQKRKKTIWIAREPSMSEFDPVGLALGAMAEEVITHNRLPLERDFQEIDGLVIIAPTGNSIGFSKRDIEKTRSESAKKGEAISILVMSADNLTANSKTDGPQWQTAVGLSELDNFVKSLLKNGSAKEAA